MRGQELKKLISDYFQEDQNTYILKQNTKYHIFGSFLPKYGQKRIFSKNWALSVFRNYIK